jgi:ATP phosphoribosyltransferase regulatory subunit
MGALRARRVAALAPARAGGFSDWLPDRARRRRRLVESFLESFGLWGYDPVDTPLVEPLDTVAAGISGPRQSELFRFIDSDGTLLALVAERTVSVARVVATHLAAGPLPVRLCYAGPVLRNATLLGGRRRESLQGGCELVGESSLEADAECIALAATALHRAGVGGVQIDVGHADFVPALLESAGLGDDDRAQVLAALARRDLVAVEAALAHTDVADAERRLLLAFPTLRGGPQILATAADGLSATRPLEALEQLGELWELVAQHGVAGGVQLDLGAVRDWDYYTGPTFEVFSRDSGFPLGSGGRYDDLMAQFGFPQPATGFVLHVDRCLDATMREAPPGGAEGPLRVAWVEGCAADAKRLAATLRERGVRCVVAARAGAAGAGDALVTGDGVRVGEADVLSLAEAADALAGAGR